MNLRRPRVSTLLLPFAAAALCLGGGAEGAPISLQVDPAWSTLTLAGRHGSGGNNFQFNPYTTDALVSSFGGTIAADLTGGVLTFAGGSSIVAQPHPFGPFVPAGPGVDNYGVALAAQGPSFWQGRFYDLAFDLTGGSATNGAASNAVFTYTAGEHVTTRSDFAGPILLAGLSDASDSPVAAILTEASGEVTLQLPVRLAFTAFFPDNPSVYMQHELVGLIVARGLTIPEPATVAIAVLAAAATIGTQRR